MPDFAAQINELTRQNEQSLSNAFSGVQKIIGHTDQMNIRKADYLRDRFENINNITKELGVLTGEFVEEKASSLRKEMKNSVLKETKALGVNMGKSIDLSRMSELNSQIDDLARLAKNSKTIDILYKDAEKSIQANTLIPAADKPQILNQVMRSMVDIDKLSTLNPQDMMQEANQLIMGGASSYLVIDNILGEVGTSTSSFTDKKGNQVNKSYSNLLTMDDKGKLSFTTEGVNTFMKAHKEAAKLGYAVGDLQQEMDRWVQGEDQKYGRREAPEEDPLDREYKRLRNAAARSKMNGSGSGQPNVYRSLADHIYNSERSGDDKNTLTQTIRGLGIDFERTKEGVEFTPSTEVDMKLADQLIAKDARFSIGEDGKLKMPINDKKDIDAIEAFLVKKISKTKAEQLSSNESIINLWNNELDLDWAPEAGPIGIPYQKGEGPMTSPIKFKSNKKESEPEEKKAANAKPKLF